MLRDLYEARRRRRIREEVGGVVISATLAALAGATAGLLLAPKSGKETREEIKDVSREYALKAKTGARDLADEVYIRGLEAKQAARETVDKIALKTETVAGNLAEKGADVVDEAATKAQRFADRAKDKAEDVADKVVEVAEDVADKGKDKAEDLKDATHKLGEDLKEKNREVEREVKKFGRGKDDEYVVEEAMTSKDLSYDVCDPTDVECKIPEGDRKKRNK